MKSIEQISIELLNYALEFEPTGIVVKELGLTAEDIVRLVAPNINVCPKCNSEHFVNNKCWVCCVSKFYAKHKTFDKKIDN